MKDNHIQQSSGGVRAWDLPIDMADSGVESITIRVTTSMTVGDIMCTISETSQAARMDWSDYALWSSRKHTWLLRTRQTVEYYGLAPLDRLLCARLHNPVTIQLPDLQYYAVNLNFAQNVFDVVVRLGRQLGIRHPEELSLAKPLTESDIRLTKYSSQIQASENGNRTSNSVVMSNGHGSSSTPATPQTSTRRVRGVSNLSQQEYRPATLLSATLKSARISSHSNSPDSPFVTFRYNSGDHSESDGTSMSSIDKVKLTQSPLLTPQEALTSCGLLTPRSLTEKARMNTSWLNSSKCLMEQGVALSEAVLLLRFKYLSLYDIDPEMDAVRINQLYGQLKWSLISDELDHSDDDAVIFGAMAHHINQHVGTVGENGFSRALDHSRKTVEAIDELDNLIDSSAKGAVKPQPPKADDTNHAPELADFIKVSRKKNIIKRMYDRYWVVLRNNTLFLYNSPTDAHITSALHYFPLEGCEITTDLRLWGRRFELIVFVKNDNNSYFSEIRLRFISMEIFANWWAAVQISSGGLTMASTSAFAAEVRRTKQFVKLFEAPPHATNATYLIEPSHLVCDRVNKRQKSTEITNNIARVFHHLEFVHSTRSKLDFIENVQRLAQFGIAFFNVQLKHSKKEDLLGLSHQKIFLFSTSSGEMIRSWRLSKMKSWHVAWTDQDIHIEFESEKLIFHPVAIDCHIVHEFIGGYVFMATRSSDKRGDASPDSFYRFTAAESKAY